MTPNEIKKLRAAYMWHSNGNKENAIVRLCDTVSALRERVAGLEADRGHLLRFAGEAFLALRGRAIGCDWDGGDVQDVMWKAGLLTRVSVTTACGEECPCAEYGLPTTCLRPSPLGLSAIDAARSSSASQGEPTT